MTLFDRLSWLYTRVPNVAPRTTRILPGTFDHARFQGIADQLWERFGSLATSQMQNLSTQAEYIGWVVQNYDFGGKIGSKFRSTYKRSFLVFSKEVLISEAAGRYKKVIHKLQQMLQRLGAERTR